MEIVHQESVDSPLDRIPRWQRSVLILIWRQWPGSVVSSARAPFGRLFMMQVDKVSAERIAVFMTGIGNQVYRLDVSIPPSVRVKGIMLINSLKAKAVHPYLIRVSEKTGGSGSGAADKAAIQAEPGQPLNYEFTMPTADVARRDLDLENQTNLTRARPSDCRVNP